MKHRLIVVLAVLLWTYNFFMAGLLIGINRESDQEQPTRWVGKEVPIDDANNERAIVCDIVLVKAALTFSNCKEATDGTEADTGGG